MSTPKPTTTITKAALSRLLAKAKEGYEFEQAMRKFIGYDPARNSDGPDWYAADLEEAFREAEKALQ